MLSGDRFWRHVESVGECRIWRGAKFTIRGYRYGRSCWEGGHRCAHALAWEEAHGPIPLGVNLRNRCGNTLCVRPLHWHLAWTPDRDAAIVARHRAGETLRSIARSLGISYQRVGQIVARESVA